MAIESKNIHTSAAAQEPSGNTVRAPRSVPAQVNAPTQANATPQVNATPPKKARRVWRALGIGVLLAACVVGAYGTMTPHGRDTFQAITTGVKIASTMRENPDLIFTEAGSDHVNILLIGRDVNWKQGKVYDPKTKTYRPFQVHDDTELARSDTMIVVSLDKARNTIRMISLPRDAIVHFPPNKFERRGKLNAAHAYGGPQFLIKTLRDELGITIHHYAVVKFEGFKKLIDQVGGVEVKVDGALKRDRETGKLYRGNLDYDDNWGNLHIHLKPGTQKLDGEAAHSYVRFRMDLEGDTGRIRRQQDVMRALAKEIMHASKFAIPGLVKEFRQQFQTDLSDEMLGSAAQFAKGLGNSAKIQPLTLFGVFSTRGSLTLNKPKNEKLLATVLGPTFNARNFLENSPTTEDDEIGIANDSNPSAREVLREAGLLKGPDALAAPFGSDAPTRVEPSREPQLSSSRSRDRSSSSRSSSSSTRRKRLAEEGSRVAPRADLSVEESDASSTGETTSRDAATTPNVTSASSSRETQGESPVPAPEESSTLSVEESPVPQPE